MAGTAPSEPIKNISEIVAERDNKILEKDIKINYYKNALEKVLNEIKSLEKAIKRIEEEDQSVQEQLDQLEVIKTSVERNHEVLRESLVNHQYFEKIVAKELNDKEKEKKRVEQECRMLYCETLEKLNQHPLFQQLEEQKVEFLKLDIKRRDLEVKIRERKKTIAQKAEIQKRIFYNFFIEMAENYLIEQRLKELEILRIEEQEAMKLLDSIHEEVKMRQKLGTSRDRIKRMTNITFGVQECHVENSRNKIEPPQPKEQPKLLHEKLNTMLEQEEPKNIIAPPKIQILSNKVVMPAFVAPTFVPSEKRKNVRIDISRKWQKLMKRDVIRSRSASQEPEKRLSQSSQQSQASQQSQVSQLSQVSQHSYVSQPVEVGQLYAPSVVETSANKQYDTLIQRANVNNKCLLQPQEIDALPAPIREKIEPIQYQVRESMNVGDEKLRVENFQLSTPTLQENPIPNGTIVQTGPVPNSLASYSKPSLSISKYDTVPKIPVGEVSKSVRFDLEPKYQHTNNKSTFGDPTMFGNMFIPFSNRASMQNEHLAQEPGPGINNSSFNMSYIDAVGENSNIENDYNSGDNATEMRSPEYSYAMEGDEQQSLKTLEMPSFGAGSFSFGKRNFFGPF